MPSVAALRPALPAVLDALVAAWAPLGGPGGPPEAHEQGLWVPGRGFGFWRHESAQEAFEALQAAGLLPLEGGWSFADSARARRGELLYACSACDGLEGPEAARPCRHCGRRGHTPYPRTMADLVAWASLGRQPQEGPDGTLVAPGLLGAEEMALREQPDCRRVRWFIGMGPSAAGEPGTLRSLGLGLVRSAGTALIFVPSLEGGATRTQRGAIAPEEARP